MRYVNTNVETARRAAEALARVRENTGGAAENNLIN
jgi:hypothetical protein